MMRDVQAHEPTHALKLNGELVKIIGFESNEEDQFQLTRVWVQGTGVFCKKKRGENVIDHIDAHNLTATSYSMLPSDIQFLD